MSTVTKDNKTYDSTTIKTECGKQLRISIRDGDRKNTKTDIKRVIDNNGKAFECINIYTENNEILFEGKLYVTTPAYSPSK